MRPCSHSSDSKVIQTSDSVGLMCPFNHLTLSASAPGPGYRLHRTPLRRQVFNQLSRSELHRAGRLSASTEITRFIIISDCNICFSIKSIHIFYPNMQNFRDYSHGILETKSAMSAISNIQNLLNTVSHKLQIILINRALNQSFFLVLSHFYSNQNPPRW